MGLSGHDKIYGIKDGHLADKKAVIRILDAGLQKESNKIRASLASQIQQSCEQELCAEAIIMISGTGFPVEPESPIP